MKISILTIGGKAKGSIELPACFRTEPREDIIKRAFEAGIARQPYGAFPLAGRLVSAAGKLRHARRKYKTTYGYGISRVPRKILTRRGERFYWIAAGIPGVRGGPPAHPPKAVKSWAKRVIKKEKTAAMFAALSATASVKALKAKYAKAAKLDLEKLELPLIVEDSIEKIQKTSAMRAALIKILGSLAQLAFPKEKKKKPLLIVASKRLPAARAFAQTVAVKELNVNHIAPGGRPGRLAVYTESAIKELAKIK